MPVGGGGLTSSPGGVTHKLEADFSGTAFGGTPTWTDITAWWMTGATDPGGSPVTIPFGRQDQGTTVESSTTTVVLNNADGRFTPGNVASPYYPHVKRRIRFRYTITDGTTTLTMYDGYADSWTVTPQTNGLTTASVSLSDTFARLSATTELRSMLQETILRGQPGEGRYYIGESLLFYAPLTDTTQTASPAALVRNGTLAPPTYNATGTIARSKYGGGSYTLGQTVGPPAEAQTALTLTRGGTNQGYSFQVTGIGPVPDLIEFWFNTSTSGAQPLLEVSGIFGATTVLAIDGSGHLIDNFSATTTGTYNDGTWHHVIVDTFVSTSAVWVDGVVQPLTAPSTMFPPLIFTTAWYFGGHLTPAPSATFFNGSLAHIAMYACANNTSRATLASDHYHAGFDAFPGETTAARWARLLKFRPNVGGATSGTVGTIGVAAIAGTSLGDALTEVATAEGGVIQTNRGSLTLIGRNNWYNPATTVTLDAANGEVDLPTTWRDDTQSLVNDVTVTRPNGASQRSFNAASVAADGAVQTTVSANLNSESDAAGMAGWLVAVGVQEHLDSPTLTVNLFVRASAALTMAVCALKTYDVVTLTNLPASAPATTMTFQVQGGTYNVGADTFTVDLYTTAMPPAVLRFDAAATTYTKLDAGNVFAW